MLSQTLKKLRENSGLTQQQVADALNLERSTYTYYETGKTIPDINTIIKLSKIFNVSYVDIFEEEEKQTLARVSDKADEDIIDVYSDLNSSKHIYELSKKEKAVITLYRVIPAEHQEGIIKQLSALAEDVKRKKDKRGKTKKG